MTDDAPILDPGALDRMLEMVGGDRPFVDGIVETFLVDAVSQLAAMREAARSGSAAGMVRPAHSLKSNSASVGAMRLSAVACDLERDAKGGQVPDAVERVARAASELDAVRAELKAREQAREDPGGA